MRRNALLAILIALLVTLTRLPLLQPGFGTDSDAWRVARVARSIANGGAYEVSRFPGYPLHEFASAWVWGEKGELALFLTALMSGVSAALFFLLLRRFSATNAVLGAFAFAMTPIVFIGGTELLDYHLALSAVLASFLFALSGCGGSAGLLIGLAVGARITSLCLLLPVLLILARRTGVKAVTKCLALTSLATAACFYPVYHRYSSDFLKYYTGNFPPVETVWRMATLGVFGVLGSWGVLFCLISAVLYRLISGRRFLVHESVQPFGVSLILLLALFLWLPLDSGYLIAAVPFLIFLLRAYAPTSAFRCTAIALMLSPVISLGGDYRGEVVKNYETRVEQYEVISRTIQEIERIKNPAVIVVGEWGAQFKYRFTSQIAEIAIVYTLNAKALEEYLAAGREIYFLPGVDEYNMLFAGCDLAKSGAKPMGGV